MDVNSFSLFHNIRDIHILFLIKNRLFPLFSKYHPTIQTICILSSIRRFLVLTFPSIAATLSVAAKGHMLHSAKHHSVKTLDLFSNFGSPSGVLESWDYPLLLPPKPEPTKPSTPQLLNLIWFNLSPFSYSFPYISFFFWNWFLRWAYRSQWSNNSIWFNLPINI